MIRAAFLFALLGGAAAGETWSVSGAASYGRTYDDEGNIGSGLGADVGASYRLTRRFSLGGEYALLRNKREFPFATWRGRTQHAAANLFVHFGSGKVQPYIIGGLGAVHHTSLSEPRVIQGSDSAFGWAWSGGFGVRGYVTDKVFVRPEVRLWVADGGISKVVEPLLSTLQVSVGVGYTF